MESQDQQISLPSLLAILVLGGLAVRYLFFSSSSAGSAAARSARGAADPAALARAREEAVERIQQMFPQVDRRTALWDLQRNGGSIAATTERILAGRLETPPVTFQPPPPPGSNANGNNNPQAAKPAGPAHPDLITRYNLKDKLDVPPASEAESSSSSSGSSGGEASGRGSAGGKAWSSNREERQTLLQKRRDQMILEARRKMEAKITAEKAKACGR